MSQKWKNCYKQPYVTEARRHCLNTEFIVRLARSVLDCSTTCATYGHARKEWNVMLSQICRAVSLFGSVCSLLDEAQNGLGNGVMYLL